jgi:hypothetical protein
MWWKKDLMASGLGDGLPLGKRVLIQDKHRTIITDMAQSTWLSAATFTTVGYGDMRPRTAIGRVFTMCIAVIGTIYTSMPITLVGGKFRSLYARHAEKVFSRRVCLRSHRVILDIVAASLTVLTDCVKIGSSASWKTRRNLLNLVARGEDAMSDCYLNSNQMSRHFKLKDEEFEQMDQFRSLKRVVQNLQRQLDNILEVNRDCLQNLHLKRISVGEDSPPVNVNIVRRAISLELVIQEKSSAIMVC